MCVYRRYPKDILDCKGSSFLAPHTVVHSVCLRWVGGDVSLLGMSSRDDRNRVWVLIPGSWGKRETDRVIDEKRRRKKEKMDRMTA